jgi:hypothetical protein
MKNKVLILSLLLFSFYACNTADKQAKSENDVDAARNFIRSALDGKFGDAKRYMLPDSVNMQYLENVAQPLYERSPENITRAYRESSINVHQVKPVNDSTTIVIYSNSFKNDHDTLKVVRINNKWLVDLKYLYQHDLDSTTNKPLKDSLK